MRLDKFLKVSRLIKRRTVANEACDGGRVSVNGALAKASREGLAVTPLTEILPPSAASAATVRRFISLDTLRYLSSLI